MMNNDFLLQMQWTSNQILVFFTLKKKSHFFLLYYWQPIVKFCNWLKFHAKKDWKWLQYTMNSWNCEHKLLSNVVEIRDWKRKNNKVGAWRQRKWKTWKHEFENDSLKMKSLEVENTKQNIV
jgi:hypothetical protein